MIKDAYLIVLPREEGLPRLFAKVVPVTSSGFSQKVDYRFETTSNAAEAVITSMAQVRTIHKVREQWPDAELTEVVVQTTVLGLVD